MRNTPKSKTAQATCKHFQWLNQVKADRELLPSAFIIAFEIGQHFNRKRGGAAWPSYLTMANAVGLDEATVVRMVRRLNERGHIKIEPGKRGRGHPNRYFMVLQKGAAAHLSAEEKPARTQVLRKIKPASEPLKPAPTQENHLEPLKASPKGEAFKVEREASLRSRPHFVAGGLEAAATKKEKREDAPKKEIGVEPETLNASEPYREAPPLRENAVVVLHSGGDHFNKLWAIWRRGHVQDNAPNNKAEAQRAFIEACNHSDPQEIIERARSWVAGFPDEPRFLPKLVEWLEARGWETEPPESRRRDNRYRRNGGKADLALLTLQHVGLAR